MSSTYPSDFLRCALSLDPLLDFWRTHLVPRCPKMADMFKALEKQIRETPGLKGEIPDPNVLGNHHDLLTPLMSVAFPSASWETEIAAAFAPFSMEAFYATPTCRRRVLDDKLRVTGRLKAPHTDLGALQPPGAGGRHGGHPGRSDPGAQHSPCHPSRLPVSKFEPYPFGR